MLVYLWAEASGLIRMNHQLKGILITATGVLLVVPDSLFVRLIAADSIVTAFWRALFAGGLIASVILLVQGLQPFRKLLQSGWPGFAYTLLMATTAPAFVLAVNNTSVANVVFIFASMPIFAAFFSWLFLSERIQRRMVLTMIPVLIGLGIIAYGSRESEIASWKGDLWAFYISAAYAGALTAVRKAKGISMLPAIPVAYIGSAVIMGLFSAPMIAFTDQWYFFLGHGIFIGAASCLLAIGPRFISSVEVSLLVLLESVLAPILVWMIIGEYPGAMTFFGGAIVIGALVVSNLYALIRPDQGHPPPASSGT